MIQLIKKTDFVSFPTDEDGLQTGKILVTIDSPIHDPKFKKFTIGVEFKLLVEFTTETEPGVFITGFKPIFLKKKEKSYSIEEVNQLYSLIGVQTPLVDGLDKHLDANFEIIAKYLIKQEATYGIDLLDWEDYTA